MQQPRLIATKTGPVHIWGHELISEKSFQVLSVCLNRDEVEDVTKGWHGVRMIVIRDDDQPSSEKEGPLQAACSPCTGSIAISLKNTLDITKVDDVRKGRSASLHHAFHRRFILVTLHEIHHLCVTSNGVPLSKEDLLMEEDAADEWAREVLLQMVQDTNVEPSDYTEHPFLAAHLVATIGKDKVQQFMLEENVSYHIPANKKKGEEEVNIHSFKRFIGLVNKQDLNDEVWASDPVEEPYDTAAEIEEKANQQEVSMHTYAQESLDEFEAGLETNEAYYDMPGPDEISLPNPVTGVQAVTNDYTQQQPVTNYGQQSVTNPLQASQNSYTQQAPVTNTLQTQPQQQFVSAFNAGQVPQTGANQGVTHFQQQEQEVLPRTNLDPAHAGQCLKNVLSKCFNKIFGECGWGIAPGETEASFHNAGIVTTSPIQLEGDECKIIYAVSLNGREQRTPVENGQMYGYVTGRAGLPCYKVFINDDGVEMCWHIAPQNTATGSQTATLAKEGNCIMFVQVGYDKKAGERAQWIFKRTINLNGTDTGWEYIGS